jgi:hypothetical protein
MKNGAASRLGTIPPENEYNRYLIEFSASAQMPLHLILDNTGGAAIRD